MSPVSEGDEQPTAPREALRRVRTNGSAFRARRRKASSAEAPGRDPELLGDLMDTLIQAEGWSGEVSAGAVLAQWEGLVGAEVAAHCTAERVDQGVLYLRTDSTAWATQVRLLTPQLISRIARVVGDGVVGKVVVAGPVAPSWKKGRKSVQGRGPRDTYG